MLFSMKLTLMTSLEKCEKKQSEEEIETGYGLSYMPFLFFMEVAVVKSSENNTTRITI